MLCCKNPCVTLIKFCRRFRPERWLIYATASTLRSSREIGLYHHHRPPPATSKSRRRMECMVLNLPSSSSQAQPNAPHAASPGSSAFSRGSPGRESRLQLVHSCNTRVEAMSVWSVRMKERINTPSSELQLKRGILGLEHRLDEMDLIGETSQPVTWLCFHEEAGSFWHY